MLYVHLVKGSLSTTEGNILKVYYYGLIVVLEKNNHSKCTIKGDMLQKMGKLETAKLLFSLE